MSATEQVNAIIARGEPLTEFEQAVILAMQVGRADALADAEKVVLDVRAKTKYANQAEWLTTAAKAIQKLRA